MSKIFKNQALNVFITIHDQDSAVVDISSASVKEMNLQAPAGTEETITCTLTGDGTDGQMTCAIAANTLNNLALWKYQGFVTISGISYPSEIGSFLVDARL